MKDKAIACSMLVSILPAGVSSIHAGIPCFDNGVHGLGTVCRLRLGNAFRPVAVAIR